MIAVRRRVAIRSCAGPAAVLVVGLLMLTWTWRKWPDIQIDFGEQLYVAWQLAEGKRLYTDIAFLHGPLAPYLFASAFRVFGAGFVTLVATNLAALAGITAVLYRLLQKAGSELSATAGCITFLAMFAFSQYDGYGNYNFLTPYESNITCGVFVSLAALGFITRFAHGGGTTCVAGAGLCVGLSLLTKPELFLACATATTFGLGLVLFVRPWPRRQAVRTLIVFAATALLPPLVTGGSFLVSRPPLDAAWGVLGAWRHLLGSGATDQIFYRRSMGTDAIGENLRLMAVWSGHYLWVLAVAAVPALAWKRPVGGPVGPRSIPDRLGQIGPYATILLLVLAAYWYVVEKSQWVVMDWYAIARPFPLLTAAGLLIAGVRFWYAKHERTTRPRAIVQLTLLIYSLMLLLKILLACRIWHYGFALAMPAALMLVVALLDWIPTAIRRLGRRGELFQAVAVAIIAVTIFAHLRICAGIYDRKDVAVGTGRDRIQADARGRFINVALAEIRKHAAHGHTLVVLPQGTILNYLARLVDPTPYIDFTPLTMQVFSEAEMLQSLERSRPDFAVLMDRDTSEFGVPFFGRDYGRSIVAWLHTHYTPIGRVGAMPLRGEGFGILLLRRSDLDGRSVVDRGQGAE